MGADEDVAEAGGLLLLAAGAADWLPGGAEIPLFVQAATTSTNAVIITVKNAFIYPIIQCDTTKDSYAEGGTIPTPRKPTAWSTPKWSITSVTWKSG
jgi:hypothetical protein